MNDPPAYPAPDTHHLRRSFMFAVSFVALLWLIKLTETVLGFSFVKHGVYPRTASGLMGILWSPLIHGSFYHVFANTAPIVVLGTAFLYVYPRSARIALPLIYVCTGIGVWLFARGAYHIGASGLVFGMMFFLFTIGVLRWDRRAIAISLMVFLLYGSMIWGVFPGSPGISFEFHLFGAVTGIVSAIIFREYDPPPPEKRYSWEDEQEGADPDDLC